MLCLHGLCLAQVAFEDVTVPSGLAGYGATMGDDHGPGGVFADLDGDGYPDLYLVRALLLGPPGTNQLFLNRPGPAGVRVFVEALGAAGADDAGDATGAIAADYDNDGDLDLYVLNYDQPNVLYRNRLRETGVLAFEDATPSSDPTPGVPDDQHGVGIAYDPDGVALDNSLTAAWADVDRDGWLDLYVGNHNGFVDDPRGFEGPYDVPGRRDVFYRNNGDGTFTEATQSAGVPGWEAADGSIQTVHQRYSSTNAVAFADLNNDGWPDLLVTNKVSGPDDRDMLYLNCGTDANGVWLGFRAVTYELGDGFGAASPFAMGVDVADVDNDGDLDVYITDWSDPVRPESEGMNDLWLNTLSESGMLGFRLAADTQPLFDAPAKLSWGARFQDFDNDGRQDLHVTTSFPFRDYLYMNTGSGFSETAEAMGVARDRRETRANLAGDSDLDGWVDLFVISIDWLPSALLRNRFAALQPVPMGWLTLRLEGDPHGPGPWKSSRDAIGARAWVRADLDGDGTIDADETQTRELASGTGNAAGTSSLDLAFGLGKAHGALVDIRWPSGRWSRHRFDRERVEHVVEAGVCWSDIDGDGSQTIADFRALIDLFAAGEARADFDADGRLTVFDFLAFQNAFAQGCG